MPVLSAPSKYFEDAGTIYQITSTYILNVACIINLNVPQTIIQWCQLLYIRTSAIPKKSQVRINSLFIH